jgi:hypothetical protein
MARHVREVPSATFAQQQNSPLFDDLVGRASSVGGTAMPRVLAVLRLMTSSSLVGTCTGRSAGLAPSVRNRTVMLLYFLGLAELLFAFSISQFELHLDWQKLMLEPWAPRAWQTFVHLAAQSCAKASGEFPAVTIDTTRANPRKNFFMQMSPLRIVGVPTYGAVYL